MNCFDGNILSGCGCFVFWTVSSDVEPGKEKLKHQEELLKTKTSFFIDRNFFLQDGYINIDIVDFKTGSITFLYTTSKNLSSYVNDNFLKEMNINWKTLEEIFADLLLSIPKSKYNNQLRTNKTTREMRIEKNKETKKINWLSYTIIFRRRLINRTDELRIFQFCCYYNISKWQTFVRQRKHYRPTKVR